MHDDVERSIVATADDRIAVAGPSGRSFGGTKADADTSSSERLLDAALNPASIAIIGASDNSNKVGGRPLLYLSRFGFRGRVYPVNPNRDEVQGLRSYPDVFALPEAPDLAVIAAPGAGALQAVADCAARGVRAAIVIASGFGETRDHAAIMAEREMVACAGAVGMRLIGPNSQGLANFGCGAVASFSTMFLEVTPADGPVGIISQSGMMSVAPYGLLRRKGIGVRHVHATGNDADVSLSELALAVVLDPAVRLLLLYIESIRDAPTLARAAEVARQRDLPIVAVKTGRTPRGQAAARSHTNALANEDRIVDAFFRQHGIWRARDVHELVGAAELYLKGWRPDGRRLVAVSNSGASCVMAADAAHDLNLELAVLTERTSTELASQLPTFATVTNPIDITAALLGDSSLFGSIISVVGDDQGVDLLFVGLPVAGAGYDVAAFASAADDFMVTTGIPIVVAAPQENVADHFRRRFVPTFASQTEAMAVLAQLTQHTALMRRRRTTAEPARPLMLRPDRVGFLSESESLILLRDHGMPTVPYRLCQSPQEAAAAFQEFRGRVVAKACSAQFPHKSDHGLVALDLRSEAEVVRAYTSLGQKLQALGGTSEGVIVAPMVSGRREFVLGSKVDPVFGPVVMIGDGGRYVEAFGDIAVMLPPFSADEVREALFTLRVAPLLRGVRGEPPLDVAALCAAAIRLAEIITAGAERIASIDVNPVMVGAAGEGLVIVDALVECNLPQEQPGLR
jgi:acyl-CoA synthetase (NDP forming)